MKTLTTLLLTLLVLGGCGYSSEDECYLKEMQKCESKSCENQAYLYCAEEFRGDSWFGDLFDSSLSVGKWALILIGAVLPFGLIMMVFSSDAEVRKEGWTGLSFLAVLALLIFLWHFIKNNYL